MHDDTSPSREIPRRRITILGGGISGLTAAYELTRTEELRARYDVTVYQMGWRLGGKLASGRNPKRSWRNEEHGLHVWFGFYENTFALADEALKQWRSPEGCPYRRVEDIVSPHDSAMFAERLHGRGAPGDAGYRFHTLHLPRTAGRPGQPRLEPPQDNELPLIGLSSLLDTLRTLPDNLREIVASGTHPPGSSPLRTAGPDGILDSPQLIRALDGLVDDLSALITATPERRRKAARRMRATCMATHFALKPLWLAVPVGARLRHTLYSLDAVVAVLRAVCSETWKIYEDGDLDRVQDLEFVELLRCCGAHEDTLAHSQILRCQYDAFFQFAEGDRTRPSYEASTCARVFLRGLIGYRGAVAWMLQTGMGEAFISPLYEVLRARGVKFEFFHRVERLELDDTKRRLARIHFTRQARVAEGTEYEPLVTYRGERVWLSEPDWGQLEDGEALRDRGVRFESRWSPPALDEPRTIEHGADFDEVVLALPLGALVNPTAQICAEWFEAVPAARKAARDINLQSSLAAQLWLRRDLADHGWPAKASVVGWGDDFSIFCDMTPVVAREGFDPADAPRSSVYLCGVHAFDEVGASSDDREAPARANAKALALLTKQLEAHGGDLVRNGSETFDWNALYVHDDSEGTARLADQYVRANIEPWDLCDGATPGTTRLRLEPHETGLENMALASTWARTGMNTTCVEGAIMSGMAAARALGGLSRPIVAEAFMARPFAGAELPSIRRARQQRAEGLSEPERTRARSALGGHDPGPVEARAVAAGVWLEHPPSDFVVLVSGELELWREGRLVGFERAPWVHRDVDPARPTALRASKPATWFELESLPIQSELTVLSRTVRDLTDERDQYLRTYDDFWDGPNAKLYPGPYRFGPFDAKILLVETNPARLDQLLPPGFRRIPGLGGHYLIVVADLVDVRALSPGAPQTGWAYRETTPLVPCRSNVALPGAYVPELYPDAPMPVMLGRETYGFPKRIGRTRMWDDGVDVIADHQRILEGRWGATQPSDPGEFARALVRGMVGLDSRFVSTLTAWTQSSGLGMRLPVYVRQQFLARDPSKGPRLRTDQIVQVPFQFMPISKVARHPDARVEFAPAHPVLHGAVRQAWAVRTGFEFSQSKVVKRLEPGRAFLRAVGGRS